MSSPRTAGTRVGWGIMGHCSILPRCPSVSHCLPRAPHHHAQLPPSPPSPSGCPAHVGEVWRHAGAFLKEALAFCTMLGVFGPAGDQHKRLSSIPVSCASAQCFPSLSYHEVPLLFTSVCLLQTRPPVEAPPSACHWAPVPPSLFVGVSPWLRDSLGAPLTHQHSQTSVEQSAPLVIFGIMVWFPA